MKPILRSLVVVLCVAAASPTVAQDDDRAHRMFTTDALRRAVSGVAVDGPAQVDPRTDWSQVRRLAASTEIIVSAAGLTARRCRFVSADDRMLTVVDLEDTNRATLQIARDDVREIRRWTGRRGSKLGAVIGAGGGVFLGYVWAVALATKQCGGSCADEKLLMGVSLVGFPVAGGLAGYYIPKTSRTLTTIYLKL